jgi:hypothetical protein
MAAKRPSKLLYGATIVAAPVALAFETLLRWILFPPEFEDIRMLLRPHLAPFGWALTVLAALMMVVGFVVQHSVTKKRIERAKAETSEHRHRIAFGVFLLTTAVPQIPAILSTFTFMFGAPIWPVLASIGVCSVGVVGQAIRVASFAGESP